MGSSPISGTAFCFHRLTLLLEPHIGNFRGHPPFAFLSLKPLGAFSSVLCSSWTCRLCACMFCSQCGASCIRSPMMLSLQFFFSSFVGVGRSGRESRPRGLEVFPPLYGVLPSLFSEKPRAPYCIAFPCMQHAEHFFCSCSSRGGTCD